MNGMGISLEHGMDLEFLSHGGGGGREERREERAPREREEGRGPREEGRSFRGGEGRDPYAPQPVQWDGVMRGPPPPMEERGEERVSWRRQ